MEELTSVLPPPYPPLLVHVWKDTMPTMKCPFCSGVFNVSKGSVKCPKCGTSYIVSEFNWENFLIGLGLGLIIGFVITVTVYYFVLRPYVPIVRLATTFREIFKV